MHKRRKKAETLVASVAAFNEDGKLLFGLRSDNNKWTLPGGHFEVDDDEEMEDPRHAAVRELREETGLKPLSLQYIGHGVVRRTHGNVRVFCFRANVTGTPTGKDDPDQECATWRWVDVKNGVPQDIEDHLKDRNNVTLRLLGIHEGEVRKHEVDEITGHSSPEPLDPVLMKAGENYLKDVDTLDVPPPGWKPDDHRLSIGSNDPAGAIQGAWRTLVGGEQAKIWQRYNFHQSRTPTESDADFMARSPEPAERAMSIKLPGATAKHLKMIVDDPVASRHLAAPKDKISPSAMDRAQTIINHPAFDKSVAQHILAHPQPFMPGDQSIEAKQAVLLQDKVPLESGDLEDLVRKFTPNMEHAQAYLSTNGEHPNTLPWARSMNQAPHDAKLVMNLMQHPNLAPDQLKRLALYGHDENRYLASRFDIGLDQPAFEHGRINKTTASDIANEFLRMNNADLIPHLSYRESFMRKMVAQAELEPQAIQNILDNRHKPYSATAFRNHDRVPQERLEEALTSNPSLTPDHLKQLLRVDNDPWWKNNEAAANIRVEAMKHKNMTPELLSMAQNDPLESVRYGALNRTDLLTPEHMERAINDDSDLVRSGVAQSPKATPEQLQRLQEVSADKNIEKTKGLAPDDGRFRNVINQSDHLLGNIVANNNVSDHQFGRILELHGGRAPWMITDAARGSPEKRNSPAKTEALVRAVQQHLSSSSSWGMMAHILADEWPQFNKDQAKRLLGMNQHIVNGSGGAADKLINKFDWTPEELHQMIANPNTDHNLRTTALKHKNTGVETARDIIWGRLPVASGNEAVAAFSHPQLTSDELLQQAGIRSDKAALDAILAHPNAGSEHLTKAMQDNPDFAADQLRHSPKVKLEHVMEGLKSQDRNVRAAALGHELAPVEAVRSAAMNPDEDVAVRQAALNTGKLHEEDLRKLAEGATPQHGVGPRYGEPGFEQHQNRVSRGMTIGGFAKQILEKESPDSVFNERVAVKPGLGKLRKIRDLITAKQGRMFMHQKELPPGDWAPGRGPDGNIHASKLQEHIDKQPALNFNVSHSEWDGAQRHSKAASKVLQVNITSDQIRKMKDAGVYNAFRKMQEASTYSSHPVAKYHGIGWVRYTGGPGRRGGGEKGAPGNYFIDEVQSDFGQSFIRQAAKQAAESGRDSEEAAQAAAAKYGSEESFKKISQILFAGKHPNEILHEAFQQHLRDRGEAGAKIQTHTVESKAPISLGRELPRKCKHCGKPEDEHQWQDVKDHPFKLPAIGGLREPTCTHEIGPGIECGASAKAHADSGIQNHRYEAGEVDRTKAPGHFNVTYNDVPKKMGMEPSTYGKLRTQSNKELKGAPTWETKLAKFNKSAEVDDPLRGARIIDDPQGIKQWAKQMDAPVPAPDHVKAQMAPPKFKAGDMVRYQPAGSGWGKLGQQFNAYEGVVQHHMGAFASDKTNPDKGGHHLYQILRWGPNGQPETVEANEAGLMAHRPFVKSAEIWLAQQKLTKAIDPAHLKPLSRYHDGALGEVFVDHTKEEHAHPDEQTPHVEAFKHHIIDSPDVVKRGKTGTKESSNSTGKVVYEVKDHQIGDQQDHRYMVKPYHEKIVPRARKWMHFPVQGWAEMTNQALYHSAQIGHLHQRVHVTDVPMPSATAPVRTDKGVQEQRKAMWSQVLNEIPSLYPTMDNPKKAQTQPIWRGVMNELGMPPGGGPEAFAAHDKLYRARLEAAGFDPDADTENIPNPAYAPDKSKAVSDQQEATYHQRMREAGIHWEQQERGPKAPPPPSKMAPALVIHMQPEVSGIRYMSPKHFSPEEKAQARQIGLMDFLTNNLDRHETNLLYDHDRGQMLAIDHSRSFQYKTHDKSVAAGKEDSLGNYIRLNSAVKNVIGTKAFGDSSAMNQWNEDWGKTFEWWKQNAPAVRKTMADRLAMVKDRTVRNHIQKNFDVRAKMLDEYARDGHENYGQSSWENTSVPIFQYK